MDKEDIAALNRARNTAGWSYLGAIIPLIGFILSAISLSNLASIEPSEDSPKARKRIKGVKKLAIGGLSLSIIVALLYGSATFLTIQHNNKIASQAAKAKKEALIKECKETVSAGNSRIFYLYDQYPDPADGVVGGINKITNEDDCNKNIEKAKEASKLGVKTSTDLANGRCLEAARKEYNHTLEINAVTITKDSKGDPIYHMSSDNLQRIEDSYTLAKSNCGIKFF